MLANLIKEQDDIDNIDLYAKDLSGAKYHFLIEKRENAGIKYLNYPKAFVEGSNSMDDVNEDIDEYNATRKRKILIVFDDMIANIMSNKKFQSVVKEVFIRCRKLNNVRIFCSEKRKNIIGFENGKCPLPKKYVPNKYISNESEIDASKSLAEDKDKDKKVMPKIKILELGRCLKV